MGAKVKLVDSVDSHPSDSLVASGFLGRVQIKETYLTASPGIPTFAASSPFTITFDLKWKDSKPLCLKNTRSQRLNSLKALYAVQEAKTR